MAPREVFVNLPQHDNLGEEVVVTTTKGATKTGTRRATWTAARNSSNLGTAEAALVTASPAVEDLPVTPGQRVFRNRVRLPPVGGDRFTVTARKAHEASRVLASRALTPVELVAWRKLYVTFNCMAGYEALAGQLAAALPAMLLPAFIRVEVKVPSDATPMVAEERVEADGIQRLVRALPDVPYARRRPADPAINGLWLRLALVKQVFGFGEHQVRDVSAANSVDEHGTWRITKQAPPSFVYAPEGSINELEFVGTTSIPLTATPQLTELPRTGRGGVRTKFEVRIDQATVAGAVRGAASLAQDVELQLDWPDGTRDRIPASSFADPVVTFAWTVNNLGAGERARWAAAARLTLKAVQVKARAAIAFPADGVAAEGTVTVAADGDTYAMAITDGPWAARLTDFFAGRTPGATLKVKERPFKKLAGHSAGANIAMAVGELTARANNHAGNAQQLILRAIMHEIIHSIGGVVQALGNGENHPKYYAPAQGGSGSGGIGHCSQGATLTDATTLENNADAQKKKTYEPGKPRIFVPSSSSICIMYHRAYTPHFWSATLCGNCVKQLRLLDLRSAALPNLRSAVNY